MKGKKRKLILLTIVGGLVAVLLIASYFSLRVNYGILEGKVFDEYSKDYVPRLRLTIAGKTNLIFRDTYYSFTKLPPGKHVLKAESPYYFPISKEVVIKRGRNQLDLVMKGKEIPDLAGIICFSDPVEQGIQIEVRYKDSKGIGISEFPGMPIELEVKLYVREGDEDNYSRGRLIYEGPVELFWDSKAYLAKNKGIIPWDKLSIDSEKEKFGIMELVLHTPQGNFEDIIEDVQLFREEE